MTYVRHLTVISCACCGEARRESETVVDAGEAVCFACHEDSRAKAALQLAKERADQFQWLSGEWFDRPNKAERRFYADTNYPSDCKGAA